MKTVSTLRNLVISLALVICAVSLGLAQDKARSQEPSGKDNFIVTAGFLLDEAKQIVEFYEYEQGFSGTIRGRITGDKTQLAGKLRYDRVTGSQIQRFLFGPEVQHRIKFLGIYGHALFGFQRGFGDNPSTENIFARTYGGGVRLYVGDHIVIEPFEYNATVTEGVGLSALRGASKQIATRVGFKF